MHFGMYLNAFVCLLIFVFATYTAVFIYRKNKNSLVDVSFAAFWLLMGVTWLFVAIDLLIFQFGHFIYNNFINLWGVQVFIFLQITAGSYGIIYRTTKNKYLGWSAVIIFLLLSFVGLYFAVSAGGVTIKQSTFISVEYKVNDEALLIFYTMFAVVILFVLFDFIRNAYYWWKRIDKFEQKYFFLYLSILIYGLVGFFDQVGFFANWLGVLFRLAIILCVLITYLAYSDQEI